MTKNEDGQTGYAEGANGNVVLTMTRGDYEWLLLALGYYIGGVAREKDFEHARPLFATVNRINAGNPSIPRYVDEEP
jgi:hypothetical protein